MPRYGFSYDEEHFEGDYASREDALEEAIDEFDGYSYDRDPEDTVSIWTCEIHEPSVSYLTAAELALEKLSEDLYEEVGECAENFVHNDRALCQAIADSIAAAIKAHGGFKCWKADQVVEHDVTVKQLRDASERTS